MASTSATVTRMYMLQAFQSKPKVIRRPATNVKKDSLPRPHFPAVTSPASAVVPVVIKPSVSSSYALHGDVLTLLGSQINYKALVTSSAVLRVQPPAASSSLVSTFVNAGSSAVALLVGNFRADIQPDGAITFRASGAQWNVSAVQNTPAVVVCL